MAEGGEYVPPLDPYQCIAKRNAKYASACNEVYLSNRGASDLSDKFTDFPNLEVIWVNGNRLARLNNLQVNFRIKEVYVQDNRLVSLTGISNLKFLNVLMARSNQLRNLDKQLDLLERFAFLKKLDLSGNPVAEEPDYRLRVIYRLPQVEILDSRVVTGPERLRAEEVVPNLDKAAPPKPAGSRRKGQQVSILEKLCSSESKSIARRRQEAQDASHGHAFTTITEHEHARLGLLTVEKSQNRELWSCARARAAMEQAQPTAWEKAEMRPRIVKHPILAGKEALDLEDVAQLVEALLRDGLEHNGRVLGGDASADAAASVEDASSGGYPSAEPLSAADKMLYRMALQGSALEVRRALTRGANVNSRNPSSWTPLIAAASQGNSEVVGTLLESRADVRMKTSCGSTALMVAILRGKTELARLLHEHQSSAASGVVAEATIHDVRDKDYLGNGRQAKLSHPVQLLMAGDGATAPVGQVADWLLSLPWPRSDAAKMAERIRQEQEDHNWADLGRNCDALEKRVAATRKALGPVLADIETAKKATFGGVKVPKDPKDAAAHGQQLDRLLTQLPKQLDEASAQIPKDIFSQLFASGCSKEVPVSLRLEGLRDTSVGGKVNMLNPVGPLAGTMRKHRSDVFQQSFLRPKRAVDESTGRIVVQVGHRGAHTTLG